MAHLLLSLPSYPNGLGVMERIMMSGKDEYVTGAAFRMKDQSSLLQMHMYREFLLSEGIDIEAVIAWFFIDYLKDEFGADHLRFRPSSESATYLEKCRHLFSEMESVLKQFRLYAENGELDLDLLSMTSEQLVYKQIPSTVPGKYVYVTDHNDIRSIQHLLFSDQSHLSYIDEELNADSLAELLLSNRVTYDRFADHQKLRHRPSPNPRSARQRRLPDQTGQRGTVPRAQGTLGQRRRQLLAPLTRRTRRNRCDGRRWLAGTPVNIAHHVRSGLHQLLPQSVRPHRRPRPSEPIPARIAS